MKPARCAANARAQVQPQLAQRSPELRNPIDPSNFSPSRTSVLLWYTQRPVHQCSPYVVAERVSVAAVLLVLHFDYQTDNFPPYAISVIWRLRLLPQ